MRCMIGAVLLLAGCASSQPVVPSSGGPRQVTRIEGPEGPRDLIQMMGTSEARRAVAATPEEAWNALQVVYTEVGIPVTVTDPKLRLLGAQQKRLRRIGDARPSRFLNCGDGISGPNADRYDVYLTALTQLYPAPGGGTEARVRVEAHAQNPAQNSAPIRCGSTGTLEERILDGLQKAGGGATP